MFTVYTQLVCPMFRNSSRSSSFSCAHTHTHVRHNMPLVVNKPCPYNSCPSFTLKSHIWSIKLTLPWYYTMSIYIHLPKQLAWRLRPQSLHVNIY